MKNNLEVLINHIQDEVDYLKSSMDNCVANWDFEGAKAYREPLIFTKRKLKILKCLQNPNYDKIMNLSNRISWFEQNIDRRKFDYDNSQNDNKSQIQKLIHQKNMDKLNESRLELSELESIVPIQGINEDKVLELLENLENNEFKKAIFEVKKDKVFLHLNMIGIDAELKFEIVPKTKLDHHLIDQSKSVLGKLGFDLVSYTRTINNYPQCNKLKVLEELSIIVYEVFGLYGDKEISVKIE